jgi:hypothetical protein
MEVQHGRRLTHNDREHCWNSIDTAAVGCLLGYFTPVPSTGPFRSCHAVAMVAPPLGVLLGRFIRFSDSSLWLSFIAYSMTFSAVLIANLIVFSLKQVDEDMDALMTLPFILAALKASSWASLSAALKASCLSH